jgi:hypothetical protein
MNHPQSWMFFEPLLDFVAGMVASAVYPQDNLAARKLIENHLQPSHRRLRVLPVDAKGRDLFAGSQVQRSVDVFGLLAVRGISDQRLLADGIPSSGDGGFQIDLHLVTGQGRHWLATLRKFFEDFMGFQFKAGFFDLRKSDVEFAPTLITPAHPTQQFAHATTAIVDREAFLDQLPNGFQCPATATSVPGCASLSSNVLSRAKSCWLSRRWPCSPPHSGLFFKPSKPVAS